MIIFSAIILGLILGIIGMVFWIGVTMSVKH